LRCATCDLRPATWYLCPAASYAITFIAYDWTVIKQR